MSISEQMWARAEAAKEVRTIPAPPRARDLWADLDSALRALHIQQAELHDLREAISFLAETMEGLKTGLSELERGN